MMSGLFAVVEIVAVVKRWRKVVNGQAKWMEEGQPGRPSALYDTRAQSTVRGMRWPQSNSKRFVEGLLAFTPLVCGCFLGEPTKKKRGSHGMHHGPGPLLQWLATTCKGCNGKQITGCSLAAGIGLPLGNQNCSSTDTGTSKFTSGESSASNFRRLRTTVSYSSHLSGGQMSRNLSSSRHQKNKKGPKKTQPQRKPPSPGLSLSCSDLMTKKLLLHHEVGNPSNSRHKAARLYLFF